MAFALEFFTDPGAFIDAARVWLAERPVVNTVIASTAERAVRDDQNGVLRSGAPFWFVVVRDEQRSVVGAGMRAASFAPYPLYVLPMPESAAADLARALVDRGEEVGGVNGALPAALVCATEIARLTGRVVAVAQRTRLFELGKLVEPRRPEGHLRPSSLDEVDRVVAWFLDLIRDANEQAGKAVGFDAHGAPDRDDLGRRISEGRVWFWVDGSGQPVSMIAANAPAFGVARVGPVFTPKAYRGRGFASASVAQVSRQIVSDGSRACLFTDQANPTSNAIYTALGYRPVVDMAHLTIAGI